MNAKAIGALVAVLLVGWLAGTARADFTLTGSQQLTVNMSHGNGWLYDQSKAWVVSGGEVGVRLSAYDSSMVDMSGGRVLDLDAYNVSGVDLSGGSVHYINAFGNSTVDISGGSMAYLSAEDAGTVAISGGSVNNILWAYGACTVDISGGSVSILDAGDTSSVNLSGGSVNILWAYGACTVTFDGQDFVLGTGLSLNGDRVLGTGILSGEWLDGTPWTVDISRTDTTATILAVPEPATLALLAMGGLALLTRRR